MKKVLICGVSGQDGAYLSKLLLDNNYEVYGGSRDASSNIFINLKKLNILNKLKLVSINICDFRSTLQTIIKIKPDEIYNLSGQSSVGLSFEQPVETFETNVMGTAHVLDSIISNQSANWALVITTDKVYKNIEVAEGYSEEDALGGKDPYSASKSASEMVVNAWRAIAEQRESEIILCVARAGNVIGGGDISKDRLMPDLIRSFKTNTPAVIRNPNSLRPWQHVLDPINGYLKILKLLKNL